MGVHLNASSLNEKTDNNLIIIKLLLFLETVPRDEILEILNAYISFSD